MIILGKSLAPGYAQGVVVTMQNHLGDLSETSQLDVKNEMGRFHLALETLQKRLTATLDRSSVPEAKALMEAHLLLLQDPEWLDPIVEMVDNGKTSEYAIVHTAAHITDMLRALDDEYMRERATDIVDLRDQLLALLKGRTTATHQPGILFAPDIHPSQVLSQKYSGFIATHTGINSHAAILARSLGLPFISKVQKVPEDEVLLNGETGEIIVEPSENELQIYTRKKRESEEYNTSLLKVKGSPTQLADGTPYHLEINIGTEAEAHLVHQLQADGVGLFRSEFIFMERTQMPSEDGQFAIYRNVVERLAPRPVLIRTLDAGGDKNIDYLRIPKEQNPYLGYRAIRIGLNEPAVLKPQLRALLRATPFGNLGIMIPMIASIDEVRAVRAALQECGDELQAENVPVQKYRLGIMIETPAAVLMAEELAQAVDFFSIGTNDLLQYLVAADRGNEKVSDIYSNYHPALFRAISQVVKVAIRHQIEVGVCGDLASDPKLAQILIGFGLRHLSCSAMRFLQLKAALRQKTLKHCESLAERVIQQADALSVRKLVDET